MRSAEPVKGNPGPCLRRKCPAVASAWAPGSFPAADWDDSALQMTGVGSSCLSAGYGKWWFGLAAWGVETPIVLKALPAENQ